MTSTSRPRPRPPRPTVAVLVALVLVLLGGCGLRLETPPPAPLTPGVDEVARQRASADAAALRVLAGGADSAAPADPAADPSTDPTTDQTTDQTTDPATSARAQVAVEAATHLTALGGLYDDGPDTPVDPDPSPTPSPAPTPVAVAADVLVAELVEAADAARADLVTVDDPGLARLLASVAVSRRLAAARVAAAAGLPAPPVPEMVVPEALPEGVGGADLATLVAAEDAAGYALEVVAAKHAGDLRARAAERAATHRARAQGWAEVAGVDGTGLDPRRVAYALPGGLEDPAAAAALVAALESTLAADYAALVAEVSPDARAAMADAVAEATATAVAWGAPLPPLPGLPEQAGR